MALVTWVNYCQNDGCTPDVSVTSLFSLVQVTFQLQQEQKWEIFDTTTVLQEIKQEKMMKCAHRGQREQQMDVK